ncbi:hypothetical protein DIRU0_E45552 [Diutina rugosa]
MSLFNRGRITTARQPTFHRFKDLPIEIQRRIYSLLDVPSICRAYVAFAPHRSAVPATYRLKKLMVDVSLIATERGSTKITFDLPCSNPASRCQGKYDSEDVAAHSSSSQSGESKTACGDNKRR